MEKVNDVEAYWRKKEDELGGPVLHKSISHTYMRDLPDTFGILFASAETLMYEYSKGGRRSVLDVILARKRDEELSETVRIPRKEIRKVALVDACAAKQWIRKQLSPLQVLDALERKQPSALLNVFCGAYLVVCSQRQCMMCDTPENRKWLQFLASEG